MKFIIVNVAEDGMSEGEAVKRICFFWHDDEHKAYAKLILPPDAAERFFRGETLEFTFERENGRIDVRQKQKRLDNIEIL